MRWGPPTLTSAARDQLTQHGFAAADSAACARELAAAVGPAARASLFVDLGACSFLDGDVGAALASWRQAVVSGQVAPAARALFNLGLLHEHLGLHDDAVERFDAAIAHNIEPYATQAVLAKARALFDGGRPERAMTSLARLVEDLMEDAPTSPLLGESLFGLGAVAEDVGQLDRAEQAYRAAMAAGSDDIRDESAVALVRVLRFIGHEDEAQQLVETTGLSLHDPVVVLDRIELLTRLGRVDEASTVINGVDQDDLAVSDLFRLATLKIDLGLVNEAIDVLEELTEHDAAETQARAAFQLGEVYLGHGMGDPARSMFGTVRRLQSGYWADKAALILGDLTMEDGKHRIAAAHWADAAASRVETVADAARDRLVDAVDATKPAPLGWLAGDDDDIDGGVADADDDLTQAIDVVALLDDDADALALGEPVADVAVPIEPVAPTVVPLRRKSSTANPAPMAAPELALPEVPADAAPIQVVIDEPGLGAHGHDAQEYGAQEFDAQGNLAQGYDAQGYEIAGYGAEVAAAAAGPEPSVVPLQRRSSQPSMDIPVSPPHGQVDESVIDLRDPTNPYADLAPEAIDSDQAPSDRNPYAELAPNFEADPIDVSMFGDVDDSEQRYAELTRSFESDPIEASTLGGEDEPGGSAFSRFA